jgi:hypothetical protein
MIQNDEDLYWRTANIFSAGLDDRVLAEFLVAALDALLFFSLSPSCAGDPWIHRD